MKKTYFVFFMAIFATMIVAVLSGCSGGGGGTTNNYYIEPTGSPSTSPTISPTASPTVSPTTSPTVSPTPTPTISPSPNPSPVSIAIQQRNVDLIINRAILFTAIATLSDGTTRDVTNEVIWSPELSFFGHISDTGLYTATWFGTDTVSAQLGDLYDSTTVRVIPYSLDLRGSGGTYIHTGDVNSYQVFASNGLGTYYDISNLAGIEMSSSISGNWVFNPVTGYWYFTASDVGVGDVKAKYAGLTSNIMSLTTVPEGEALINFVIPQGLNSGWLRVYRSDQVGVIANYRIENGHFTDMYYGYEIIDTAPFEGGYQYRFQAVSDDGLIDGWWPSLDPTDFGEFSVGWAYWVFTFTQ